MLVDVPQVKIIKGTRIRSTWRPQRKKELLPPRHQIGAYLPTLTPLLILLILILGRSFPANNCLLYHSKCSLHSCKVGRGHPWSYLLLQTQRNEGSGSQGRNHICWTRNKMTSRQNSWWLSLTALWSVTNGDYLENRDDQDWSRFGETRKINHFHNTLLRRLDLSGTDLHYICTADTCADLHAVITLPGLRKRSEGGLGQRIMVTNSGRVRVWKQGNWTQDNTNFVFLASLSEFHVSDDEKHHSFWAPEIAPIWAAQRK